MTGLLGFILLIASIVCGYNEIDYILFIVLASILGSILYYVKSPINNLLIFAQDSYFKLISWIIWVFVAQAATWSLFYWIGKLFA